jgi:hypothetical protein
VLTLQDIRTILLRATYPASKQELIDHVRRGNYPEEVEAHVQALPEAMYGSVDTVMDLLRNLE